MQVSSQDPGNGITKQEILKSLRGRFTSRQMTEFCSKGWLPTWRERRSVPSSKKPVYLWAESVIEQATLLYELLQVSRADHWVRLALWLRGYPVDFAPIRQRWLDSIDAYLQTFTQGKGEEETYPGDGPEDHISRAIGQLKDRWKHTPTPRRPEPLRRLGLEAYAQWVEVFWDVLLVADYEADETTFAEVLAMVSAAGSVTQLQGEFAEGFLSWLQTLQEILAIPRLREVIEQTTPEEWEQARLDYETLCQFCQTLFAPVTRRHPKGVNLLQFVAGGFYLVPVALAIQYRGYGQWIDDAFEWASELFADPDMQALLAKEFA